MFEVDINFIAVVAAAVLAMVIGALWYSPLLFGKNMKDCEKPTLIKRLAAFFNCLVVALVLAYFIELTAVADITEAAILAAAIWLGFIATTLISGVIWGKETLKVHLIVAGYYLVSYVAMSILITWITYR